MELTRRDALAALSSAGIVAGSGAAALSRDWSFDEGMARSDLRQVYLDLADILYPSAVSNVEEFVSTYTLGRVSNRPEYRDGAVEAANSLDGYVRVHFDTEQFTALESDLQRTVLDRMGVDTADPDPGGTDAQSIRYHLVNELLYALYTSPAGAELVGIENPQGYPGGTESYQRGPPE
jgi:hypothetical protein